MKKSTFYIRLANREHAKYQLVSGYIDTINGIKVGFHKGNSGFWHATHIPTGFYITGGCTRLKGMVEVLLYCIKEVDEEKEYMQNAVKNMQEFLKTVAQ